MKRNNSYVSILKTNMKEVGTKITSAFAKILHRQMTAHANLNAVTSITYFIFTSFIRIPQK